MAERIRKDKAVQRAEEKVTAEAAVEAKTSENAEKLKDELDALLEEIDEALGENLENAQAFVDAFQQKGGQ